MQSVIIIIAVLALAAWGPIAVGVRMGASKAAKKIVDGFLRNPDLTCSPDQVGAIGRLRSRRNWDELGETLVRVGLQAGHVQGAEFQSAWDAPKPEEVRIDMSRSDLADVAWLADYGLRVWTMPYENRVRVGCSGGRLCRLTSSGYGSLPVVDHHRHKAPLRLWRRSLVFPAEAAASVSTSAIQANIFRSDDSLMQDRSYPPLPSRFVSQQMPRHQVSLAAPAHE